MTAGEFTLPHELLRDSEATLRMVDTLLGELRDAHTAGLEGEPAARLLGDLTTRPAGVSALPGALLNAASEVAAALEALRISRSALERSAEDRVHRARAALQRVSAAAALASADLVGGLDRALGLTDRLDELAGSGDCAAERAALRAELARVRASLDVQDDRSRQLHAAAALLGEVDARLAALIRDLPAAGKAGPASALAVDG